MRPSASARWAMLRKLFAAGLFCRQDTMITLPRNEAERRLRYMVRKVYDEVSAPQRGTEEFSKRNLLTRKLIRSGYNFDIPALLDMTSLLHGKYCFTERNQRICRRRSLLRRAGRMELKLPPLVGLYDVNLYLVDKRLRTKDRLIWLWRTFKAGVREVMAQNRAVSTKSVNGAVQRSTSWIARRANLTSCATVQSAIAELPIAVRPSPARSKSTIASRLSSVRATVPVQASDQQQAATSTGGGKTPSRGGDAYAFTRQKSQAVFWCRTSQKNIARETHRTRTKRQGMMPYLQRLAEDAHMDYHIAHEWAQHQHDHNHDKKGRIAGRTFVDQVRSRCARSAPLPPPSITPLMYCNHRQHSVSNPSATYQQPRWVQPHRAATLGTADTARGPCSNPRYRHRGPCSNCRYTVSTATVQ
jgi:hypothetical protein